jgi:NADH-dependent peroxiredoxin subunit F
MFSINLEKPILTSIFDTLIKWDLIIIGGGPAGLNAALYAKRKGLKVGIISKDIGGQLHNTSEVDNYLGFTLISAEDLIQQFRNHLESLDVPILNGIYVIEIKKDIHDFELILSNEKRIYSKTVLIATGGTPKKLEVPGEMKYANKGVSYCTTCDAPFFKDKHLIVAGGGNSAAEAVLDLVPWANKITVVHRSKWRADEIILEKLKTIDKLEVFLETQILEIIGNEKMNGIRVLDQKTQSIRTILADGIFIEIGTIPKSDLVKDFVELNTQKEIIVDSNQRTKTLGLYAAGDITNQVHKQIIISAADGAKAALDINFYINHIYQGEKK